jgi:hypothetical protein
MVSHLFFGIVSGPNVLSGHFLLSLFWGHLEELPPLCAGPGPPEPVVRTLPFALTLAPDTTMPVQALEIEEPLAAPDAGGPAASAPPVDACPRPPGPHGVAQAFLPPA